jgi:Domain of unknown function (DUF929).
MTEPRLAAMARSARSVARERAERARQARERAARRARRIRTAWWVVAAAPAFVALLVLIRVAIPDAPTGGADGDRQLSSAVIAALRPDPSLLDSVGRGQGVTPPTPIADQPPLTADGKPLVLYVGAEYCPFCASQRWPLAIALSRFGSFTGLTASRSARDDVYPNTATISFHGSTYVSEYLAFQGVELATNERQGRRYKPLDTLTPEQEAVVNTYNAPPYAAQAGSIPFLDFGNRFLQTGASVSPQLLAGLSHDEIAAEIVNNPDGPVAQAILGSANAFTAALCVLTDGQPGEVCDSPAAAAYQAEVGR